MDSTTLCSFGCGSGHRSESTSEVRPRFCRGWAQATRRSRLRNCDFAVTRTTFWKTSSSPIFFAARWWTLTLKSCRCSWISSRKMTWPGASRPIPCAPVRFHCQGGLSRRHETRRRCSSADRRARRVSLQRARPAHVSAETVLRCDRGRD